MKKRIFAALFALVCMCTAAFAQAASVELKNSDVEGFIKNFNEIDKKFEELGIETAEDGTIIGDAASIAKADSVLKKAGISGPNRFKKVEAIVIGAVVAMLDKEFADIPETSAYGDPIADLRGKINEKDYKVVSKYADKLEILFEDK